METKDLSTLYKVLGIIFAVLFGLCVFSELFFGSPVAAVLTSLCFCLCLPKSSKIIEQKIIEKDLLTKKFNIECSQYSCAKIIAIFVLLILIGSISPNNSYNSNYTYQKPIENKTEETTQHKSLLKQMSDNGGNIFDSMENMMDGYYESTVENEIKKYNMAKQQGDSMNACMSAGMVAQGYYELKDTQNYNKWKNIEKQSCSWMNY